MSKNIVPPRAKTIPEHLEIHGDVRVDNYYWLNDRENPEVIDYLEKENTYCEGIMAHTKDFQNDLFEEMKSRIKEDDESVPYKYNGYWYIVRFKKDKDYPIYTRKKGSLNANEETLFDCNEMAKGHPYFKLSGINISPDNTLASFGIDTVGRRQYTIQIKNLITGKIYDDCIKNTTGLGIWGNDNKTFFFTTKNEQTLRAEKIYRHKLGDPPQNAEMIFKEKDEIFGTTVYKSKSNKYIVIASYSTLTTEYQILNANTPDEKFKVFQPRIRGLEYNINHFEDEFYIVTNVDKAINFKLMKTHEETTGLSNWQEVIPHREDVLLEGIDIFKDFLVISERSNGLNEIKIKSWDGSKEYNLPSITKPIRPIPLQILNLTLLSCAMVITP